MRRFIIGSLALTAAGVLVGCSESNNTPTATSYGYRSAPSAYAHPSRFGSLPARTEGPSHSESVQGFPPGHPLHQDNSYQDEPVQHQADENALPHTNYNY